MGRQGRFLERDPAARGEMIEFAKRFAGLFRMFTRRDIRRTIELVEPALGPMLGATQISPRVASANRGLRFWSIVNRLLGDLTPGHETRTQ